MVLPPSAWTASDKLGFPALLGAVIGGRWRTSGSEAVLDVEDPATGESVARSIDAGADIVDEAMVSADAAFCGPWHRMSPVERGRILFGIAAGLRAEAAIIAEVESIDTGKPLSQAKGDVELSARYFEYYAGVADKFGGETIPQAEGSFAYTVNEPYGVIVHITPWNSPLAQMCRGVAPSLAAGNAVVVKPSELTPLTSLYAALLFTRHGLPAGVCNVVPGSGPGTGALLAQHHLVRRITFTGSVETGRRIMAMASERIVPCNLELGGKSPTIILPDADMEAAATAGAAATARNSGQSCFATTRLLVHFSRYDELVERIGEKMARFTVGRGLEDPDLGPLVSAGQLERVRGYLAIASEEGVKVVQPGVALHESTGHFQMPTLLVGVENHMRVAREEIFGPVQSVFRFDDVEEAIAMANDSDYGLAAGVFTRDLALAHRIAALLEAGQIQVNRYPAGGVDTPFGGYKQSGIGREKGIEALRHYTQVKTVIMAV